MAKIGDKFMLEIGEVYNAENGQFPSKLYKVRGFNSLVFDDEGIRKLSQICNIGSIAREGYQDGMNNLWKTMQNFVHMYYGLENSRLLDYFGIKAEWGDMALDKIFESLTPQQFIDKVNTYCEPIKIGDEIKDTTTGDTMYVMRINKEAFDGEKFYYGITAEAGEGYSNYAIWSNHNIIKTGKHNENISKHLAKINEEFDALNKERANG
jgi:hypothetical protein